MRVILMIGAAFLAACSPVSVPDAGEQGIRGLRLGMTTAEVEQAASTNGWAVGPERDLEIDVGQALVVSAPDCDPATPGFNCTSVGTVYFDGGALSRFRLNGSAMESVPLSPNDFAQTLIDRYGVEITGSRMIQNGFGEPCTVHDGTLSGMSVIIEEDCSPEGPVVEMHG